MGRSLGRIHSSSWKHFLSPLPVCHVLLLTVALLQATFAAKRSLNIREEDHLREQVKSGSLDQEEDILKYSGSTGLDYSEKISLDIENEPASGLKKMIKFLKNGDERMIKTRLNRAVRIEITLFVVPRTSHTTTEQAQGKQHMFVRNGPSLIQSITSLLKHPDIHVRHGAAEVESSCTRPPIRHERSDDDKDEDEDENEDEEDEDVED
eukprot:749454-Hanusia_phi.AAC.2